MYRNFIINHDIPEAMLSKSNYLAALGLSTYTEVFGGLYRGDLSQYNGRKNYTAFIKDFFHEEYMSVTSLILMCDVMLTVLLTGNWVGWQVFDGSGLKGGFR